MVFPGEAQLKMTVEWLSWLTRLAEPALKGATNWRASDGGVGVRGQVGEAEDCK